MKREQVASWNCLCSRFALSQFLQFRCIELRERGRERDGCYLPHYKPLAKGSVSCGEKHFALWPSCYCQFQIKFTLLDYRYRILKYICLPITSVLGPNPAATRSKAWVCGRSLNGGCGFASRRTYGRLSLLSVVCGRSPLRRADHSSRGVLPSELCLIVILKPQQ
jgi:hypothetical protein